MIVGFLQEAVDGGLEIDDRAEDTAFVRAIAVKRSAKSVTAITVVTGRAGDDCWRTPGAGACKFGPLLSPGHFHGRGFLFVPNNARSPPLLDATGLSQQEVFKDEFALTTDKRLTANTAGHVLKDGLRASFDFDPLDDRGQTNC